MLIPFLEEVVAVAKANKKKPWGKAVEILPSLKSYLNVFMVFLMRDILIPTEVLNKILQSDSLLPHELNSKVADTKAVLTAMCLGAGIDYNLAKNLNAFIDNVDPVDQSWCPGGDVKIYISAISISAISIGKRTPSLTLQNRLRLPSLRSWIPALHT